jgi:hypothetical protein
LSVATREAEPATGSSPWLWQAGLVTAVLVYAHNALPYLTTMPRVNVDEPWLMERAYQVLRTGVPSQPMLGLEHAYLLQVGYGYLLAGWMAIAGVGLLQARLLGVLLGLGIVMIVAAIGRRTMDPLTGVGAALFLATDSNFLGGVRYARTDIPSVFFVVLACAAYLRGVHRSRTVWFMGAGVAILCHGNAVWAAVMLLAWYLLDHGRRAPLLLSGYAMIGGGLLTLGPYLAVVVRVSTGHRRRRHRACRAVGHRGQTRRRAARGRPARPAAAAHPGCGRRVDLCRIHQQQSACIHAAPAGRVRARGRRCRQ